MMAEKFPSNHSIFLIFGLSMLGLMACTLPGLIDSYSNNATSNSIVPTNNEISTPVPTATNIPPKEETADFTIPVLATREVSEEVEDPKYILDVSYPVIENGGDNGDTFNIAIQSAIDSQINEFILSAKEVEEWRLSNMPESASGLYINYTITSSAHNLISVKFDVSAYTAGAAHPNPYSIVYNFDLAAGKDLSMEDLFQPGSDYLQKVSEYCISVLQANEYVFPDFQQSAGPKAENYRNWNIQQNGILITFDVYQIAPYAAGPQMVLVPYDVLRDQIDDQSPLNAFLN